MQATLPFDISKIINDQASRMMEEPRPRQSLAKHVDIRKPRISQGARLKRSIVQKEKIGFHKEKNVLRTTPIINDVTTASKEAALDQRGRSTEMLYEWHIENRFAYLRVRVRHQFIYNEIGLRSQETKTYSISNFPRHWLCYRAMQLYIQYDRARGLSSPATIQLLLPCMRLESNPIVTAIYSGCLETVRILMRSGPYRPYDMIKSTKYNLRRSLLNVSICISIFQRFLNIIPTGYCSAKTP